MITNLPATDAISPIDMIAKDIGHSLVKQQDRILGALIRERLPEQPDITLNELSYRLEAFDYPFSQPSYREWVLDGRPLVRFWPPEISYDPANVMQVNQKYQVYL